MSDYNDLPSNEEMLASTAEETGVDSQVSSDGNQAQPAQGVGDGAAEKAAQNQQYLDLVKYGKMAVQYKANGRDISEPLETVLKRASQGYNYAQEMGKLNSERSDWEKRLGESTAKLQALERWKQFDEYAAQNPQWADHVHKAWEDRHRYQNGFDPDDPIAQKIAAIESRLETTVNERLSPLEQRLQAEQRQVQEAKEDGELESQVRAVQERFKNVNLDQVDEQGKSLEYRVLEHMQQTGIKNFESAFKDFYFDELIKSEKEAVAEKHANEMQKRAKQGIIGLSSTPPTGSPQQSSNGNLRKYSYDDLAEMAKRELASG